MMKKIIIGVLALVVLLGAAVAYMMHRNRQLSPMGQSTYSNNGLEVLVDYSRPSVKGRLIFGEGEEALLPYGVYWRLGANESTEITFNKAVTIQGKTLEKGTHKVYCYPGEKEFEFAFAPANGNWGYSEPDKSAEYFRVMVPVSLQSESTEQFTITVVDGEGNEVLVHCDFDKHRLSLPFVPAS